MEKNFSNVIKRGAHGYMRAHTDDDGGDGILSAVTLFPFLSYRPLYRWRVFMVLRFYGFGWLCLLFSFREGSTCVLFRGF